MKAGSAVAAEIEDHQPPAAGHRQGAEGVGEFGEDTDEGDGGGVNCRPDAGGGDDFGGLGGGDEG